MPSNILPVMRTPTDSAGQEPGGLVGGAQDPVELVGADSLLAAAHQVRGHEPLGERDFGALENRPHGR